MSKICMLMILDGWGHSAPGAGNAITTAHTPYLDTLFKTYPHTLLQCHGPEVGLPAGIMGNSEVGHLNIGAGRIVHQNIMRIDRSIADGSFFKNKAFNILMDKVKKRQSSLHLMGLLSDGGVHSQFEHVLALLDLSRQKGLTKVFVHPIMDGRDTPPNSGINYIKRLQEYKAVIASLCGRYYAMDRDNRWERVAQAYDLYTRGQGRPFSDPQQAIQAAYQNNETDEFIKPMIQASQEGVVKEDDGIIFFNFRADRVREITEAFTKPDFKHFKRVRVPSLCGFVCMTLYDAHFNLPMAFSPISMNGLLGGIISEQGFKQLRIAETEKYAHVTYFFNGGKEEPFQGEDRYLIPSPRDVDTYDLKPAMSAPEVTREVMARLQSEQYQLIVLNFANMDMVGHTGKIQAAVSACESVDQCVAQIVPQVHAQDGAVIITADHGNAETMLDQNGKIHTAHTLNPVPFILADSVQQNLKSGPGILGDIAPTILDIMELPCSEFMTGKSLLKKGKS